MPRETVDPIRIPTSVLPDGEAGDAVIRQMPTVQVGWQRELGEIQLGLETPFEQSGQYHLVDHLYADSVEAIGKTLVELLRSVGRDITDEFSDQENPAHDVEVTDAVLGRIVLDAVTGADGHGHPGASGWTGWYTHLDRRGAARLIRVLQKAAAGTFGKDPW